MVTFCHKDGIKELLLLRHASFFYWHTHKEETWDKEKI